MSESGVWIVSLAFALAFCLASPGVSAAPTGSLHIIRIGPDGNATVNETTVSFQWLEQNLPVQGDGKIHYYHQGPVFVDDKEGQWDANETANFKDEGAVKGTDIADLTRLVGGMGPADEVMVHAIDGYHVEFGYPNIFTPLPRQGPIVVCWYNGEETTVGERQGVGYPPDYFAGMRLVFFADTSTNAGGEHVFGNTDMRAVMPADDIHLFDNLYPSTNGYTVKWIDEIRVYEGGYRGLRGSAVKSFESKATEEWLPDAPSKAPFPIAAFIASLGAAALLFFRRRV